MDVFDGCAKRKSSAYHSITTSKHDLPLYVFSKTSTILTMCRHPLAAQCKSTSRRAFGLSCSTFSAYLWFVARLVHCTTLPLMPRPSTVFEISYASVIGVFLGWRGASFDPVDCIVMTRCGCVVRCAMLIELKIDKQTSCTIMKSNGIASTNKGKAVNS